MLSKQFRSLHKIQLCKHTARLMYLQVASRNQQGNPSMHFELFSTMKEKKAARAIDGIA